MADPTVETPFHEGPFQRLVAVAWSSLPTYVAIYCTADRTGLAPGTPHVATVTLSAAALLAGCQIVLNTGATLGDPYNAYFKLVVIKVPGIIPGVLFTLGLSGTLQQIDLGTTDYFCGDYSQTTVITDLGTYIVPGLDPDHGLPDVVMHSYNVQRIVTAPDGTVESNGHVDIPEILLAQYLIDNPTFHVGTVVETQKFSSYYNDDGHLVNTGLACEDAPTGKVEQFPFDVEVVVNPQKDHTISDPGSALLYDPGAAVKIEGSGTFGGDHTSIWRTFLDYRISQGAPSGVTNGSVGFRMQNALFAVQRKETIIEVYPSTALFGIENLTYRGQFRLNKGTPSPNLYSQNWDGTPPDFNDGITLFGGSPPPPVPYTPYGIPF